MSKPSLLSEFKALEEISGLTWNADEIAFYMSGAKMALLLLTRHDVPLDDVIAELDAYGETLNQVLKKKAH
jgi:L-serine deaminase